MSHESKCIHSKPSLHGPQKSIFRVFIYADILVNTQTTIRSCHVGLKLIEKAEYMYNLFTLVLYAALDSSSPSIQPA